MLTKLRDDRGRPSIAVRALAVAVAVGMLLLAAPALLPVLRWASSLLF